MTDKRILFQVPATVGQIKTMANKSIRIEINTQENISSDEGKVLLDLRDKFGWFNFLHTVKSEEQKMIEGDDVKNLPPLNDVKEFDNEKTPSEMLRDRLFVYFTKKGGKPEDFKAWRIKEMNVIGKKYLAAIN